MKLNTHILTAFSYPDTSVLMVQNFKQKQTTLLKLFVRLILPALVMLYHYVKLASIITGLMLQRDRQIVGFLQ